MATLSRSDLADNSENLSAFFLTDEQLDALMLRVKEERKGHKLHESAPAPYVVFVDGEVYQVKTLPALKKLLRVCHFPGAFDLFRNYDKGVTIDLDGVRQRAENKWKLRHNTKS